MRALVELASRLDFLPVAEGWEERSLLVGRGAAAHVPPLRPDGKALTRLERADSQDLEDVTAMLDGRLVDRARLLAYRDAIEPLLYRFPALDPASLRRRADTVPGSDP